MAVHDHLVITGAKLTLGAATLSLDGVSMNWSRSVDLPEDTVWGDTFKQRLIGLQDYQGSFEALIDYTDDELDEDLDAIMGTAVAVAWNPVNTTNSATNPQIQFTGAISNLTKTIAHGQVAKVSGNIMLTSGTITRAVA
jgi:hypothetical protein